MLYIVKLPHTDLILISTNQSGRLFIPTFKRCGRSQEGNSLFVAMCDRDLTKVDSNAEAGHQEHPLHQEKDDCAQECNPPGLLQAPASESNKQCLRMPVSPSRYA